MQEAEGTVRATRTLSVTRSRVGEVLAPESRRRFWPRAGSKVEPWAVFGRRESGPSLCNDILQRPMALLGDGGNAFMGAQDSNNCGGGGCGHSRLPACGKDSEVTQGPTALLS